MHMAEARPIGVISRMLNSTDQGFCIMRQVSEIVGIIKKATGCISPVAGRSRANDSLVVSNKDSGVSFREFVAIVNAQ